MSVRSAQAVTVTFFTETGADADSLPTAELVLNGTDNASATVTHVSTGRYTAAVTLPTLAVGDIVEIAVSATVASAAEKFVAWRDTADVALSSAGGVTLADGVAHGGTPGSSTATLALHNIDVTSSGGTDAVAIHGGAAAAIGLHIQGGATGGDVVVLEGLSDTSKALYLYASTENAALLIENDGGPSIECYNGMGPNILVDGFGLGGGIKIVATGSGNKALLLSGAAATDTLAIQAGAGSPIDVFNADGSVNAALTEAGLDAVDDSELTAAPTNFRQRLRWLCQRFGTKGAKTKSGTSGTIVVKTAAGATATTQDYTDDGAGNQTQDNAS